MEVKPCPAKQEAEGKKESKVQQQESVEINKIFKN